VPLSVIVPVVAGRYGGAWSNRVVVKEKPYVSLTIVAEKSGTDRPHSIIDCETVLPLWVDVTRNQKM
jgi:hypothetical protein